ncbi:hypothetical protein [Pseudomonas sp. 28 E 9]
MFNASAPVQGNTVRSRR